MSENRKRKVHFIPATKTYAKRVAIYCWVSTLSEPQANSLEMQKYGLKEIVKGNTDWTLYHVYEDKDTGMNKYRPGFDKMIRDSYENLFDIILVKSISRFSRNTVDLLETVTKLKSLGVEVRFENICTDTLQ